MNRPGEHVHHRVEGKTLLTQFIIMCLYVNQGEWDINVVPEHNIIGAQR